MIHAGEAPAAAARGLAEWHRLVRERDAAALPALLADGVVFRSPILYRPQVGRDVTVMYLTGALHVLVNGSFDYVGEIVGGNAAVLEFRTVVDEREVNGVDVIRFDDDGRIAEFTVMVRPLSAAHVVQRRMGELLAGGPT